MNHLRRIFAAVATLAGAVLVLAAAPAALASPLPPPGGDSGGAYAPGSVIATGGMPGWQITLIAVGAALVAAALAVLLDRTGAARRTHARTA